MESLFGINFELLWNEVIHLALVDLGDQTSGRHCYAFVEVLSSWTYAKRLSVSSHSWLNEVPLLEESKLCIFAYDFWH